MDKKIYLKTEHVRKKEKITVGANHKERKKEQRCHSNKK